MKQFENENRNLKQLFADSSLNKHILQDDIVEVMFDDHQHLNHSPWLYGSNPFANFIEEQKIAITNRSCPIFLHIPKTAGSTFRNYVNNNVSDSLSLYDNRHMDATFIHEFRTSPLPRLITGHLTFGIHLHLGVKPFYMTLLRHPLERLISLYRFNKQTSITPYSEETLSSFRKFLLSKSTVEECNNHMCRIISGAYIEPRTFVNERWLLEMAIFNLTRYFSLVGTVVHLGAFVSAFSKTMGCDPPSSLETINKSSGPGVSVDASLLSQVTKHNSLDFALYEHVAQLCAETGIWLAGQPIEDLSTG